MSARRVWRYLRRSLRRALTVKRANERARRITRVSRRSFRGPIFFAIFVGGADCRSHITNWSDYNTAMQRANVTIFTLGVRAECARRVLCIHASQTQTRASNHESRGAIFTARRAILPRLVRRCVARGHRARNTNDVNYLTVRMYGCIYGVPSAVLDADTRYT